VWISLTSNFGHIVFLLVISWKFQLISEKNTNVTKDGLEPFYVLAISRCASWIIFSGKIILYCFQIPLRRKAMLKQLLHRKVSKRPILGIVFICLIVLLAACGGNPNGSGSGSTPTPATTPVAFKITSIDLSVNPNSIAGMLCGSSASFTYTTTFHMPVDTAGGTIQFAYTLNNGRSQTNATVTVAPGETTKTSTFTSSGTLPPDHTYPGIAEVLSSSPNVVHSPQVKPAGSCTAAAAFKVTSIDMAVSPTTIAGKACGTSLTVTYTATFHLAANSLGGTIQFVYTVNNGRSSPSASVTVAPGETTKTYSFTWSGNLPADHTYPEDGGVITSSPNAVASPLVKPDGLCS
jgi:hypothetical protein